MSQEQYRPNLSATEIAELLSYIPVESRLYKKFARFQAKVAIGLAAPAYVKTGAKPNSLESRLGLGQNNSGTNGIDHLENQRTIREKLELQSRLAPQLMSDSDRLELLAQRFMASPKLLTEEELEEGRALELKVHGADFGFFS